MTFRYGRKPRRYDQRIPHFSSLRRKLKFSPVPPECDYTAALPDDLGMMLNNQLEDCAEAGIGHGIQCWTANAAKMLTVPDSTVEKLYSEGAGYVPGNPATDQGTELQSLLTFLTTTGMLMPDGTRHKILGFFELDPRNDEDLNIATAEGCFIYCGAEIPQFFETQGYQSPGAVWDVFPSGDQTVIGGHCYLSAAYRQNLDRPVISWGRKDYLMTRAFKDHFMDEAYAIVDQLFMDATGKTPFGMTESDWDEAMAAIKVPS